MNIDEQVEILMQSTEYGDEQLKQAMANELRERLIEADNEGRPLKVYCGFDPRTTDLHLGHTVPMRKLRQFQELGHEVTFVVGNYTSLIGDPSDKDELRLSSHRKRLRTTPVRTPNKPLRSSIARKPKSFTMLPGSPN